MIRIQCPHCAAAYRLPDGGIPAGKAAALPCPKCGTPILLQVDRTPTAEPGKSARRPDDDLDRRIIDSVKDLPAMPQVLLRAQRIMADPESGIQDLTHVIQTDQAIADRLIKLANSPFYGVSGRVSTVAKAASMLGQKALYEILMAAGCAGLLDRTLRGYGFGAGEMWRHSIAVATGARTIAELKKAADTDIAYLAGLIHDSGKLILDPYVRERRAEFDAFLDDGSRSFLRAERHVFGFDHAEIASDICQKWMVPEAILMAVRYHHAPSMSDDQPLAYIVHVADHMARRSGFCYGDDDFLYSLEPGASERLGMSDDEVAEVSTAVTRKVLALLAKSS